MTTLSANRYTRPPKPVATDELSRDLFLHIPHTAFTLSGFREWVKSDEFPEKLRSTFINGEIYLDMTREAIQTHVVVKQEIGRVVMNLNLEADLGQFYTDGVFISNEAGDVANNPDGIFVLWETLEAGRVRLVDSIRQHGNSMEIEGSPDWALEVISNSSVRKDTKLLRQAYHKAQIVEYWLVDARGPEILFQILYWQKRGYAAAPTQDGWQRSRVFGRSFRLVRKQGRLGLWQYTLQVRPE